MGPTPDAHSLAYERRRSEHRRTGATAAASDCLNDRHLIYLTAQIDNRVGAVEATARAVVELVCAGME